MKDKKILKQLRDIAGKLPVVTEQKKTLVSGEHILRYKPNAKDGEGQKIQADKAYHVVVPIPKNHYRTMKKLFTDGGNTLVNDYIRQINEMTLGNKELMQTVMGGLNERKQMFQI